MAIKNQQAHETNKQLTDRWLTALLDETQAQTALERQKTVASKFHDDIINKIDWSAYTFDKTPEGGVSFSRNCLADNATDVPLCIVAYAWPTQSQDETGYQTPIHAHNAFCRFDIISGELKERFYTAEPLKQIETRVYKTGDYAIDSPAEQSVGKPYIHSLENNADTPAISCHIYAVAFDRLLTELNVYYTAETVA